MNLQRSCILWEGLLQRLILFLERVECRKSQHTRICFCHGKTIQWEYVIHDYATFCNNLQMYDAINEPNVEDIYNHHYSIQSMFFIWYICLFVVSGFTLLFVLFVLFVVLILDFQRYYYRMRLRYRVEQRRSKTHLFSSVIGCFTTPSYNSNTLRFKLDTYFSCHWIFCRRRNG